MRLISHYLRVAGDAAGTAAADGGVCHCSEYAAPEDNDYVRLPGLYRRWEIQHVVDAEADFNVEPAGCAEDGTQLFSVYRRERPTHTHCQKEE